jgi:hypothetical protein
LPYSNETSYKLSYKRFSFSPSCSPSFLFSSIFIWNLKKKKKKKIEKIEGVTSSGNVNKWKWGYPRNVRVSGIRRVLISNNFFYFLNMHRFSSFITTFSKSLFWLSEEKEFFILFFLFFFWLPTLLLRKTHIHFFWKKKSITGLRINAFVCLHLHAHEKKRRGIKIENKIYF